MSVSASRYGTSYDSADSETQPKRLDQLLEQQVKQVFKGENEFPQEEIHRAFDGATEFPEADLRAVFEDAEEFPEAELEMMFSLIQQYRVDGRASVAEEDVKALFDSDFDVEDYDNIHKLATTSCGIVTFGCGMCSC